MEYEIETYSVLGIIAGVVASLLGLFIFEEYTFILIIAGMQIILLSVALPLFINYQHKKEIEEYFPIFLKDIAQECEAGATLPKAIKSAASGSYGKLTNEIKKMVYKISLGVNSEDALREFSEKWNITSIQRSVTSVIEAEKAGGTLYKTLNSVANSVYLLEDLKKERRSRSKGFMASSYVIYLILIVVMFVLLRILNSFVSASSAAEFSLGGMNLNVDVKNYFKIFQELIVIQGIFTGLAIGKTGEGDIKAGIIHMVVLSSIGFTIFTIMVNMMIL